VLQVGYYQEFVTSDLNAAVFVLNPAIHKQQLNSIKSNRKNNGEGCLSCSTLKIQVFGEVTLYHLANIKKIPATLHKKDKKFSQTMYRLSSAGLRSFLAHFKNKFWCPT
jgi:hypothetical protein